MVNAMYYIALLAPHEINERVLEWKHFMRDHYQCQAALRSPAHITLIPPFWMATALQPQLQDAICSFSSSQAGFTVELSNFGSFRPRVIFVNVILSEALLSLSENLEQHLQAREIFPIKQSTRPFHPHVTIATRDLQRKDYQSAFEHFKNKKYSAAFEANGVSLMKHNGTSWDAEYKAFFPSA